MEFFMNTTNTNMEVAMIGVGHIAKFHLEALQAVGINVSNIAASFGSRNVDSFAKENQIINIWKDPLDLIQNCQWKALVILTPTEPTLELLKLAMEFKRPIFTEKPVAHKSTSFQQLDLTRKDVMVGFNRRFYPEIQKLKQIISESSAVNLMVEIPETVTDLHTDRRKTYSSVFQNSVHMLDLVQYLVGDLKVESSLETASYKNVGSISCLLSTTLGHTANVLFNFNSPSNFSISVDIDDSRYVLRPIEEIRLYRGMSVSQPTNEIPFRIYHPNLMSSLRCDPEESQFKPGFFSQALAFRELMNNNQNPNNATLESTYKLIKIVEQILKVT